MLKSQIRELFKAKQGSMVYINIGLLCGYIAINMRACYWLHKIKAKSNLQKPSDHPNDFTKTKTLAERFYRLRKSRRTILQILFSYPNDCLILKQLIERLLSKTYT